MGPVRYNLCVDTGMGTTVKMQVIRSKSSTSSTWKDPFCIQKTLRLDYRGAVPIKEVDKLYGAASDRFYPDGIPNTLPLPMMERRRRVLTPLLLHGFSPRMMAIFNRTIFGKHLVSASALPFDLIGEIINGFGIDIVPVNVVPAVIRHQLKPIQRERTSLSDTEKTNWWFIQRLHIRLDGESIDGLPQPQGRHSMVPEYVMYMTVVHSRGIALHEINRIIEQIFDDMYFDYRKRF